MAGQVGWKSEATWGTAVTVDTFMPVLNATPTIDEGYIRTEGIRAGRYTRNPARLGARTVGGSIEMELPNLSAAALLKHLFGSVSTAGAGPYTHTYTPGSPLGDSLTIQVGIEDAGGTVRPFTFSGAKPDSFEISASVGEVARLSFDYTAKDVVTATALASASYASGLVPFVFTEGTVSVNGSAVASARSARFSGTKNLRNDRHVLGSRTILQQLAQDKFDFTTEITADFDDLTLFALYAAGTQVASVLTFNNGTETLTITCSGQVVGEPPALTTQGLEEQTIRLDHSHASSDATAVTAELVNSESSAA